MTPLFLHWPALALSLTLTGAAVGATAGTTVGSGVRATEARTPAPFESIALAGPMKLIVRQAERAAVQVQADDNVLPLVETVVETRSATPTLLIRLRDGESLRRTGDIVITVDAVRLTGLSTSGSGAIEVESLKTPMLRLAIAGAGEANVRRLDTDRFEAMIAGSGDIRADGESRRLKITIAGSGDADLRQLSADDVEVGIAGSGDAQRDRAQVAGRVDRRQWRCALRRARDRGQALDRRQRRDPPALIGHAPRRVDNRRMTARGHHWRHPEFRRGAADMSGIALGVAAWGLVTGVAMVKTGLSVPLALLMSALVFSGSAQLAALPLITGGAPMWVVWLTALCVNLRFVILSAQWRPYFAHLPQRQRAFTMYFAADLNYVLFMQRFPEPAPAPEQLPYFWGGALTTWGAWQLMSVIGILFAQQIPTEWGIGFAGVLALLGVVCSMLTDRASWVAAGVAGAAAVAAYALPLKLNIVVAIAAAVAMGLLFDHAAPRPPLKLEKPT